MPFEIITISVNGLQLQPVTFAMTASAKEAARSFDAKVKHPLLPQAALIAALANSPPATIRAMASDGRSMPIAAGGGTLLLTGHVERRKPRIGGDEAELSISGRSKTGDLVDSSHDHKTGEMRDKTSKEMISEVTKPFGISVEQDVAAAARKLARLRPGETIFSFAERLVRVEGFSLSDTPEGNLKIVGPPKKQHAGTITEGADWPAIKDGSADLNDSKRFKDYKTRAQAPDGYAPAELEIDEKASDSGVRRPRLRVITPPEQISREEARKRAKHHRDRAAGRGVSLNLTVKGWRDIGGQIWTPGWLVPVEIPSLGIGQLMMIESISLKQSQTDTETTLNLVDPRAYGGKGGKGSKSGKGWSLDGAGAEDA